MLWLSPSRSVAHGVKSNRATGSLWEGWEHMRINNGENLPSIHAVLDGEDIDIAQFGSGSWTVVLFYRGHW